VDLEGGCHTAAVNKLHNAVKHVISRINEYQLRRPARTNDKVRYDHWPPLPTIAAIYHRQRCEKKLITFVSQAVQSNDANRRGRSERKSAQCTRAAVKRGLV